ncbi:AAA family ATPase [Pyxidicoccus sp. QH1ED-7-1]|nr:AAA family ATPase [Pyxidicoccus xibeiensis]
MRFCGGCGSPLSNGCPDCGVENPPGFRFCGQCAAPLEGTSRTGHEPSLSVERGTDAELRQVTVLFCDLVGSTQLSDTLDPEELREVVRKYQGVAGEVIARYDGHVAQYLGDGLLIYFGYPQAHEDDARRAVSAGLEIIEAVKALNGRFLLALPLAVRLGIHTGVGVAGDVGGPGKREQLVIGRTPNIAARLQGLAEPDTLVISEETRRLVEGCFILESMGLQTLKGIEKPIEVLRVSREAGPRERSEAARRQKVSPLVGRQEELAVIHERIERSHRGVGQVLLLVAEAGVGKSRLVRTLEQRVHGEAQTLIGRCLPYGQTRALLPMVELFQSLVGFERGATKEQKLEKLMAFLTHEVTADGLAVPLMAAFFSLPLPAGHEPVDLSPRKLREQTRRLLVLLLLLQARKKPLVLVVEDLHWADASTLDFLDELVEAASSAPILTVLTARPTFQVPWKHRPYFTALPLSRIDDEEARRLISEMAGSRQLPEPLVRQILDKADGIPLFLEELTRATLESARPLGFLSIPATLRDSLVARLDRLGPVKELAQLASAIGRRFSHALLSAVSAMEPLFLRRHLDQLQEAGLVLMEEASGPLQVYKFKHVLIQEAAYESILKTRRREMHERIAQALELEFPEVVESRPELFARHLEEAGQGEKAARYLHRAGQQAMERAAYAEALAAFDHALTLVSVLEAAPGRDKLELELRTSKGGALLVTHGYCAPEVEQNVMRARDLCERLGNPPERVPVLFNLWLVNLTASRREPAQAYARKLLEAVRTHPGALREVPVFCANGTTLFFLGRFDEARIELHRALQHYSPELHPALVRTYGDDHGLYAQVFLEWLHLLTGQVDRARVLMTQTLVLAEHLEDPLAQALACNYASVLYLLLGEPEKVREFSERSKAICLEQGFSFWLARSRMMSGWSHAKLGAVQEGVREIEEGLSFFTAIQQQLPLTYYLSLPADVHLATGDFERGLARIDQALACAATNLDRFYLPELYRLKGELLQASGARTVEVLEWLEKAVAHARDSGASWLELKAAKSLAVLLEMRGETARARELIASALCRIHGGERTRDYREARRLLERLESARRYSE